jgi:hypothetical protein
MCAEFLGWDQSEDGRYWKETPIESSNWYLDEMKFHSDWNWIMDVVGAIDKLEFFSFDIQKQPFCNLNVAQVNVAPLHPYGMSILFTSAVHKESKKEAVIQAIWEFLQLDSKLKNGI